MIKLSIDVTKITKDRLYPGKNGAKYLSAILVENRDGPDQFGNAGFIAEDVSKEERESGVKGKIIGNYKELGGGRSTPAPARQQTSRPQQSRPAPAQPDPDEGDDIPF